MDVSKNYLVKDVNSSGPVINHNNKIQSQINTSEKCINNDVEVASNGSHVGPEKGKIMD